MKKKRLKETFSEKIYDNYNLNNKFFFAAGDDIVPIGAYSGLPKSNHFL